MTTNNVYVIGVKTGAWEITLVSYYFEPGAPIAPYLQHLEYISDRVGPGRWIIGGDANAKRVWWGSAATDARGVEMTRALDSMGLNVVNKGEIPTFDVLRGGKRYCSHIDVTACSINLLDLVGDWEVTEDLTGSDHNGIIFHIHVAKYQPIKIKKTTRIYNTKKANWTAFREKIGQLKAVQKMIKTKIENINTSEQLELDETVKKFTKIISETCNLTIPKKNNKKINSPCRGGPRNSQD